MAQLWEMDEEFLSALCFCPVCSSCFDFQLKLCKWCTIAEGRYLGGHLIQLEWKWIKLVKAPYTPLKFSHVSNPTAIKSNSEKNQMKHTHHTLKAT